MRVGLNLVFLHERSGGVGRYARQLIPALLELDPAPSITAFVSRELPPSVRALPWADGVEWVELPVRTSGGPPGGFALALAAQWGLIPLLARRRGVDVIHGLANVAPLWGCGAATVVTLLDLVWLAYPETMTPAATRGMRMMTLPSVRRADRVIAISHAAKEDIVARLGVDAGTVDVTPLGVSAPAAATATAGAGSPPPAATANAEPILRERLGLRSQRVLLCVSATNPHKNIGRLLEAFARLSGEGESRGMGGDTALVIAGASSPNRTELEHLAHQLAIETRVRFLDWVSEEDLEGLYGLADGVVYPSLMEGFGLPVLEAMQRGVPVACSSASAVGEVAGDAAELFDPFDVSAVARALDKLLNDVDRRAELVRRGKRRCELYSWSRTARATIESYERAIAEKR